MNEYRCENHKLNLACLGCIQAWIKRHDAMKDFLIKFITPLQDRDDYFESWQKEARELLEIIGERW